MNPSVFISTLCITLWIACSSYAGEHDSNKLPNGNDTVLLKNDGNDDQVNTYNNKQQVVLKKQHKKVEYIIGGQSTDGMPKRLQLSINN